MRHASSNNASRVSAESLIETMIAVSVIVIATMAAMTLIRTSLTGNNVIGEKIVALNLGLEGIEAVRNIRDSNYLKFPSDSLQCWNTLEAELVVDCPFDEKIAEGITYYLVRSLVADPVFAWDLEQVDPANQDDGWLDLYEMQVDIDNDGSDETLSFYSQTGAAGPGITSISDRAFKRTIEVVYDGTDAFDATVTVSWNVKGVNKTLTLTRTIANIN